MILIFTVNSVPLHNRKLGDQTVKKCNELCTCIKVLFSQRKLSFIITVKNKRKTMWFFHFYSCLCCFEQWEINWHRLFRCSMIYSGFMWNTEFQISFWNYENFFMRAWITRTWMLELSVISKFKYSIMRWMVPHCQIFSTRFVTLWKKWSRLFHMLWNVFSIHGVKQITNVLFFSDSHILHLKKGLFQVGQW